MKLKTLKDLPTIRNAVATYGYSREELRQEAIKWYLEFEHTSKKEAAEAFVKFFNITEKDIIYGYKSNEQEEDRE